MQPGKNKEVSTREKDQPSSLSQAPRGTDVEASAAAAGLGKVS